MRKWTRTRTISIVMHMSQTAAWPVERFRATLDRVLDETGLSQGGLARLVDMNQSQISRWKAGSSRPKFDTLKEIGEKVRAKYPSLSIGPNELLESAGYSPPEPVIRVSQAEPRHGPPKTGATVERYDDRRLRVEMTLDQQEDPDDLKSPTLDEQALMAQLRAQGKPPETIIGTIRLVRLLDALRAEQEAERTRREA